MIGTDSNLADHLVALGGRLSDAAARLRISGDVLGAEDEIVAAIRRLTLLQTAALCLDADNADHARRILDFAAVC